MAHKSQIMKYFTILTVFIVLLAGAAQAQDEQLNNTPRAQILHDLELDGLAVKSVEDLPVNTMEAVIPDAPHPERIQKTAIETINEILNPEVAQKISDVPKVIAKKTIIEPAPASPKKTLPKRSPGKIAPFYLSAADYLALRKTDVSPQTILYYKVESGPVSGTGFGASRNVKLVLGTDFAAIKVGNNTTIYDFKFDRILSLKPEYGMDGKVSGKIFFDNTSLYAKVYRDISAVRGVTQNGKLKKLAMGKGVSLDAFWIESAMSWAADRSDAGLTVDKSGKTLTIDRNNETVFSAEFSDEVYNNGQFKNTLLAFAHVKWPLHPSVLKALYAYDSPPKKFAMLSYGPTAPKGQKQVWTLVSQTIEDAGFPLPGDAIGTAQMSKTTPLVFLIKEAVSNRALGGIQSVKQLTDDFNRKLDAEQYWQAWIAGQKYMAYSGGCKNPDDPTICQATEKIEKNHIVDMPKRIQDYMTAVNYVNRPGLKGEAINIIAPYLDKKETPAFIIRTAAMARAKMKPAQASSAGVADMNAEILLQTALAKDPYDPYTYVGLAQVMAAKGAFEQSWDIYDALRVGIPTADSVNLKINRLEQNLRKTAPGYFLDD